jgi:hypothetical protein
MAAKNSGNGGDMQYGDDDVSRKRIRKENGVRHNLKLVINDRKLRLMRQSIWPSASLFRLATKMQTAWSMTR